MREGLLWDIHQLLENYPAFKEHGIRWLIRTRKIPMVKIGKRIYFQPSAIFSWVEKQKLEPVDTENI